MYELLAAGLLHGDVLTVSGRTVAENIKQSEASDHAVVRRFKDPVVASGGLLVMSGNLFDSAVMKRSVIGEEFRKRYLSNPKDPNAFVGRAVVFDGPEDYHARIDDPKLGIDEKSILVIRYTGLSATPGRRKWSTCSPQPH